MPEDAAVTPQQTTHTPTKNELYTLLIEEARIELADAKKENDEKTALLGEKAPLKHANDVTQLRVKIDRMRGDVAAYEKEHERGLLTTKERDGEVSPLQREIAKLEEQIADMDAKFNQAQVALQNDINFNVRPRIRVLEQRIARHLAQLSKHGGGQVPAAPAQPALSLEKA